MVDWPTNRITGEIVDAAYKVHTRLGPGLLERAYELFLAAELRARGLDVKTQVPIPLELDDIRLDVAFRADLIVENRVLVELKSTAVTHPSAKRQTLTYLRFGGFRVGLLLNFGMAKMVDGTHRFVRNYDGPLPREDP